MIYIDLLPGLMIGGGKENEKSRDATVNHRSKAHPCVISAKTKRKRIDLDIKAWHDREN